MHTNPALVGLKKPTPDASASMVRPQRTDWRSCKEWEQLVATISQQVQSDLALVDRSMTGASSLVPNGDQHSACIRAIARIRRAVATVLELDPFRIGSLRREPVCISAIASDAVEDIRTTDDEPIGHITIQPEMWAHGSLSLLHQLFAELAIRASRWAGKSGSDVEFAMTEIGYHRVYVINWERQSPVLPCFSREDLSFARRVIQRHGGQMWMSSSPGGIESLRFTLDPDSSEPM